MPALALVKAGILMPSHSLRFVGATPTEGTKAAPDLGYNCAQRLPPNPKTGRIFPEHGADFWAEKLRIAGRILPVRSAEY